MEVDLTNHMKWVVLIEEYVGKGQSLFRRTSKLPPGPSLKQPFAMFAKAQQVAANPAILRAVYVGVEQAPTQDKMETRIHEMFQDSMKENTLPEGLQIDLAARPIPSIPKQTCPPKAFP